MSSKGTPMGSEVRAAMVQTRWTGDKDSMVDVHEKYLREAAAEGARVMCFQELFYGPYFCQVQEAEYYDYAEAIPDGPTTKRFQELAAELGMVLVLPMYEKEHGSDAVEELGGRPGNLGFPVFQTAVGRIGVYICYDRHFPEGWRALGVNGAQIVFNPSATSRGLSSHLWQLEQPAAAVANMYYVGAINRVGIESLGDNDFYGTTYFVDPRGQFVGEVCSDQEEELLVRDLDLDLIDEVRNQWAFYRDRRPDTYQGLVTP